MTLERLSQAQPDLSDSRQELVRLALTLGRFDDAERHLTRLLSPASLKQALSQELPGQVLPDPELLVLWGQCLAGQGQYEWAELALRAALQAAPDRIDLYDRLSQLLQDQLSRPAEAAVLLDEMVAGHAQSAAARVVRSNYRWRHGNPSDATEDMIQALALAPDDPSTILAAAELAQNQGRLNDARESTWRTAWNHVPAARPSIVRQFVLNCGPAMRERL